jgi:hypothetical protein
MGVWESSCLGGAQYSLPEQANLTLIFFPKIVGEGGGGHQKFFSGHTPKHFSGHTYKHSTKFSRHSKKNSHNFRKDTKIFLRHQNFSEIFMFCPNFAVPDRKHFGGTRAPPHAPPAHTPMNMGSPFPFLYLSFSAQIPFSHACT